MYMTTPPTVSLTCKGKANVGSISLVEKPDAEELIHYTIGFFPERTCATFKFRRHSNRAPTLVTTTKISNFYINRLAEILFDQAEDEIFILYSDIDSVVIHIDPGHIFELRELVTAYSHCINDENENN